MMTQKADHKSHAINHLMDRNMKGASSLEEKVEALVDFMTIVNTQRRQNHLRGRVGPGYFSGAEPLFEEGVDATSYERKFLTGVDIGDIDKKLNTIWLEAGINEEGDEDPIYHLNRYRFVRPSVFRGHMQGIVPPSKVYLEHALGFIDTRGKWVSVRNWYGLRGKIDSPNSLGFHDWWNLENRTPVDDKVGTRIQLAMAAQFLRPMEWRVQLGYSGNPKVSFATDAVGAAGAFRLRDIPEGKKRRTALIHWVGEHWRKKRKDNKEEVRVREHLRGGTTFSWNGLDCLIFPSEDEIKTLKTKRQNELLKQYNDHNNGE